MNWQELYHVARDGLPWHILATDATVDWEDMAGLEIKQTGAATGMTAAMTRQRRKAAAPRCSATSGHVSRTQCSVII